MKFGDFRRNFGQDEIAIDAEDSAAAEPAGESAENCKPMPFASGLHSSKGASEIAS